MCKRLTLPTLFSSQGSPEYWLPEFHGKSIGNNNKTYDLDLCETTSDGILCGQQSRVDEPCLLEHSVNDCKWTILPLNVFEMFVEANARSVCLVTNSRSGLEEYHVTTPFIGRLENTTHLTWHGQT